MKHLLVSKSQLGAAGRWDIDFHLPPVGIRRFPNGILAPVREAAEIVKSKRDPTLRPDTPFLYVDIASVDVETGSIVNPQELTGAEAPSRARKVIHAYDLLISTCRPTRGAIAVVPENLHGQICSTGFSVIRAKDGINPFFLHFILRLDSTLEQFRKWSTGSSYPAILDEDVAKTLVPLPDANVQDQVSKVIRTSAGRREEAISAANSAWKASIASVISGLESGAAPPDSGGAPPVYSVLQIQQRVASLPPIEDGQQAGEEDSDAGLFDENGED